MPRQEQVTFAEMRASGVSRIAGHLTAPLKIAPSRLGVAGGVSGMPVKGTSSNHSKARLSHRLQRHDLPLRV
jgi:hypothetical protein